MSIEQLGVDEVEQLILDTIGGYEVDLDRELAVLVSDLRQQLLAGDFKNRTGDLRRSMQVALIDSGIKVSMLDYGYYLSFGVNGQNRANALGLPEEVASAFGVTEGHKFGSSKVWGIDPRQFYPLDLELKIFNILEKIQQ